jgi:Tannase and feruloyl esterase
MWHNSSDEKLTPFSSINWYQRLAAKYGGYAMVQRKARLFMLPGTAHCSMASVGPNSFDSIGALENWVEKGQSPNTLIANVVDRQYAPGLPKAPALARPNWTMPLCKFPEMARYSGKRDTQDGKNWSCSAQDKRHLTIGETGRQAGVLK